MSGLLGLVKYFEGYSSKAYKCPGGVWTVGYGTTRYPSGTKVRKTDICSQEDAEAYLAHELDYAKARVLSLVEVELTGSQLDALTSFVYNLGAGSFRASTLHRRINESNFDDVPYQFSRWVYAGGRKLRGLVLRRKAEADLWQQD